MFHERYYSEARQILQAFLLHNIYNPILQDLWILLIFSGHKKDTAQTRCAVS